jgi:hypothetical protein
VRLKPKPVVAMLAVLLGASPFAAQVGTPARGQQNINLGGIWHPVVGSGGAYDWTIGADKHPLEMTVVGKEDVEGKTGYWVETVSTNPNGGQLYYKALMVANDSGLISTRTIIQRPGQPPMETNTGKNPAAQQARPVDMRDQADLLGTETITVPAGTFTCQHYRAKDGSSEVWVSDQISPWELVKTQSKTSSMVLTKVLADAKDKITGTPRKPAPVKLMPGAKGQQAK